jgi:hypothetical protein
VPNLRREHLKKRCGDIRRIADEEIEATLKTLRKKGLEEVLLQKGDLCRDPMSGSILLSDLAGFPRDIRGVTGDLGKLSGQGDSDSTRSRPHICNKQGSRTPASPCAVKPQHAPKVRQGDFDGGFGFGARNHHGWGDPQREGPEFLHPGQIGERHPGLAAGDKLLIAVSNIGRKGFREATIEPETITAQEEGQKALGVQTGSVNPCNRKRGGCPDEGFAEDEGLQGDGRFLHRRFHAVAPLPLS